MEEIEIRRIVVPGQLGQRNLQDSISMEKVGRGVMHRSTSDRKLKVG
jgi:hypothetical protein